MKKFKPLPSIYNSTEDLDAYVTTVGGFDTLGKDVFELIDSEEPDVPGVRKNVSTLANKPLPATKTQSSHKLSIHELSKLVLGSYHIRNIGGMLYVFDDALYMPAKFDLVAEMIRNVLCERELVRLNMQDFKGAFEYLLTIAEIKMPEVPMYPGLVMFDNGLFDIITGEYLSPSADRVIFHRVQAEYQRKLSETPTFDMFLKTCSGNDLKIQKLILAFIGYCLLPDQGGKCFFVLGTAPNSGKSILAALLQRLVGEQAVSSLSLNDLHGNFALAPIVGKALNLSMDLNADCLNGKAVSIIKMLTGGDMITINEKYLPMFSYKNMAKFIFATNSPILLKHNDDAFWDRMVIVPFIHSVAKEEQDKNLLEKLWFERNGIVAKSMKAARRLIENNYIFPECPVAEAMKIAWSKSESLSTMQFVRECCNFDNPDARTFTHRLYAGYIRFCEKKGLEIESGNQFSRILGNQLGLKRNRWSEDGATAQRGFLGIRLITD